MRCHEVAAALRDGWMCRTEIPVSFWGLREVVFMCVDVDGRNYLVKRDGNMHAFANVSTHDESSLQYWVFLSPTVTCVST